MASDRKLAVPVCCKEEMLPLYATSQAAGADLKADIPEALELASGERMLIPTGLRMAVPDGWEAQVRPRSGLALKKGLTLLNSPGTIDSDYRGEVGVILINLSSKPVLIEPGERIAQLVIAPVTRAEFTMVSSLPESSRGEGGFGSTGT